MKASLLKGRILTEKEIKWARHYRKIKLGKGCVTYYQILKIPGLIILQNKLKCNRCQTCFSKEEGKLAVKNVYYCPYCLVFGRITSKMFLYIIPYDYMFKKNQNYLVWEGKLSKYQQRVAQQLCLNSQREQLVWAVTGAGKTEMIYPLLNQTLNQGLRICYLAPRIDVVNELGRRFQSVFPHLSIPILHGQKESSYVFSQMNVMTIHQLVRFVQCFDLLIIDEVDAFPYNNNVFLQRQVYKSLRTNGKIVYLTATLTDSLNGLQKTCLTLPLRYHLQPLVVPKYYFLFPSYYYLKYKLVPGRIKYQIFKLQRQVLIFFPNIQQMQRWTKLLQEKFPNLVIKCISSKSSDRMTIIEQMHAQIIQILCTTIILERGVTFPNIDVWIMDAHHKSFTKQALIQIAGRVGRKSEYPTGNVLLFSTGRTTAINEAIKEIRHLNKLGKELLYEM